MLWPLNDGIAKKAKASAFDLTLCLLVHHQIKIVSHALIFKIAEDSEVHLVPDPKNSFYIRSHHERHIPWGLFSLSRRLLVFVLYNRIVH